MRLAIAVGLAFVFCFGLLSWSTASQASEQAKIGFLIPSQCKSEEGVVPQPKGATDAWPAPHTTQCALQPACIESGYGLWVRDRFYRLDEAGQVMALEYFHATPRTSYNKVVVMGDFSRPGIVRARRILAVD